MASVVPLPWSGSLQVATARAGQHRALPAPHAPVFQQRWAQQSVSDAASSAELPISALHACSGPRLAARRTVLAGLSVLLFAPCDAPAGAAGDGESWQGVTLDVRIGEGAELPPLNSAALYITLRYD